MVKTPHFHCRGHRFDSWLGNYDPMGHCQKKKKKKAVELRLSSEHRALECLRLFPSSVLGCKFYEFSALKFPLL